VDELPYLLSRAGDLDRLRETISNLKVFSRLVKTEDGRFDLIKAWQMVSVYRCTEISSLFICLFYTEVFHVM